MPAFMELAGIKGESTDSIHDRWIIIESMSAPIFRSIPEGAVDQQRTKGETTLGDVVVVRELDKSSTKLQAACANGTFYKEVKIHFCATVKNAQEAYLAYTLKNVILTGYSIDANGGGDPLPTEEITMNYSEAEWTYILLDPRTGDSKGRIPGRYSPGEGAS